MLGDLDHCRAGTGILSSTLIQKLTVTLSSDIMMYFGNFDDLKIDFLSLDPIAFTANAAKYFPVIL